MKKGISESKVQRMRNIVKGDYTKSVSRRIKKPNNAAKN